MKEIVNKLTILLVIIKTKYWDSFLKDTNITLQYYKGYPIIKLKNITFTFFITLYKWPDDIYSFIVSPWYN